MSIYICTFDFDTCYRIMEARGARGQWGTIGQGGMLQSVNFEHSTEMVILSFKCVSGTGERAHFHQFHLHKKTLLRTTVLKL